MDHRYNPTFYDTVVKQARWVTRHKSCLYELAYKRPGSHECSVCKLRPVPGQVGLTLYVDNVTTPVTTKRNSRGTFLSYTCRCGTEQTCACSSSPINFPARLADEMATRQARSVADADLLVDAMTDDDGCEQVTESTDVAEWLRQHPLRGIGAWLMPAIRPGPDGVPF